MTSEYDKVTVSFRTERYKRDILKKIITSDDNFDFAKIMNQYLDTILVNSGSDFIIECHNERIRQLQSEIEKIKMSSKDRLELMRPNINRELDRFLDPIGPEGGRTYAQHGTMIYLRDRLVNKYKIDHHLANQMITERVCIVYDNLPDERDRLMKIISEIQAEN